MGLFRHILIPLLGLMLSFELLSQPCPAQDLTLGRQTQIDSFSIQYPDCTQLTHGLTIKEEISGDIVQLAGLKQLVAIGDFLEVVNNQDLPDFDGLQNVSLIGGRLLIQSNARLESIDALGNLRRVDESLLISENVSLSSLASFKHLRSLPTDLTVTSNSALQDLSGLDSLQELKGNLIISNNNALRSLSGLNHVRIVGQNLHISDSPELSELSGLDSLMMIQGDLIIDNNNALMTLRGLNQLVEIGGFLHILNCASLVDLQGLSGVTSISGLLQIYNNPVLTTLAGLDAIDHESIEDLAIIDCPSLNVCDVASICGYLQNEGGKHSISQNEQGCNDREEILSGCPKGGPTVSPRARNYSFYPNPTSGRVRFSGDLGPGKLTIRDVRGRLISTQSFSNSFIDLSLLAPGVYSITLTGETNVVIKPVVKI